MVSVESEDDIVAEITREAFIDKKTPTQNNKTRKKKRGNGRGVIKYRRNVPNPYMAMVCCEKYVDKKNRNQCRYKSIGSFALKKDAEKALSEYYRCPYELSSKVVTFSDLYNEWLEYYKSKNQSSSAIRSYKSAYSYCNGLYDMKIQKIGPGHIKDAMNKGYIIESKGKNKGKKKYASDCTKERIKSLCNLMFDYAIERKLLIYNPSRAFDVNDLLKKIEMNKKVKKTFSNVEVKLLWDNLDLIKGIDIILVGIYTGFRPQELCLLEIKNIHLDEGYIIGGMKTVNGTNRMVPIHPLIKDIINRRYEESIEEYSGKYLFNITNSRGKRSISYDVYRHLFTNIMNELELEGFSPHCTRHTFVTQSEVCNMRTVAKKLILGHSQRNDVTDSVYTHIDLDYLRKEISKLRFEGDGCYG